MIFSLRQTTYKERLKILITSTNVELAYDILITR